MMLLMVCLVSIAGAYFAADMATAYSKTGANLTYINSTSYSTVNTLTSTFNTMQSTMSNANRTGNFIDNAWNFIGFMSGAFINTGLLFLNMPGLLTNMLAGVFNLIPIPAIVVSIIGVAIIVVISMAVYRTIAKSDI